VQSWSRTASRVQVWLDRPREKTTIHLSGWAAVVPYSTREPGRFVLPVLHLISAEPQRTLLHVTAAQGLTLAPWRLEELRPLGDKPRRSTDTLVYETGQTSYRAEFLARPAPPQATVRLLSTVEARDGKVTFLALLDYQSANEGRHSLTLHLRDWDGGPLHLDTPGVVQRQEKVLARGERLWTLTLPAGGPRQYTWKLSGELAVPAGTRLRMPDLTAQGAVRSERWLAVMGSGLQPEQTRGLQLLAESDIASELRLWPIQAERIRREGSLWKVQQNSWQLAFQGRGDRLTLPVQVLLVEHAIAATSGPQPGHEATYHLYVQSGADLTLELPPGARLEAAALDGTMISPRQPLTNRFWLPLTGTETVRQLRLRWSYAPGIEGLDNLNLAMPRVLDLPEPPVVWAVQVPAGFRGSREAEGSAALGASPAVVELSRAAAELQLSTLLAGRLAGSSGSRVRAVLEAAQGRFYWHCRQAEQDIAAAGDATGRGPAGQRLDEWLRDLRLHNARLARAQGFEKLRAASERQPKAPTREPLAGILTLPESGTPYYLAAAGTGPSHLGLVPFARDERNQAMFVTGIVLIVLAGMWILSYLPGVVGWLHRLLPEQMVLLGWLGWQTFSLSPLAALLIVTGVAIRLAQLLVWAWTTFAQPEPVAAAPAARGGTAS
jgi:hypothetical protein